MTFLTPLTAPVCPQEQCLYCEPDHFPQTDGTCKKEDDLTQTTTATQPVPKAAEQSFNLWIMVIGLVLVALVIGLVYRWCKKERPEVKTDEEWPKPPKELWDPYLDPYLSEEDKQIGIAVPDQPEDIKDDQALPGPP